MAADPKALEFFLTHFPDFSPYSKNPQLLSIFASVEQEDIPSGSRLYVANTPIDKVYLLKTGTIQEQQQLKDAGGNAKIVIRIHQPGHFIGEYDLIYRRPHSTSALAGEDAEFYVFRPQEFFRLLYYFPGPSQSIVQLPILKRLRTIPFLARVTPTVLGFLAGAAKYLEVDKDGEIYKSNANAEYIYLIDVGQVKLTYDDGTERWLGNSQPFGLLDTPASMIGAYDLDHSATSVCHTAFFCWDRQKFIEISGISPERLARTIYSETRATLEKLSLFSNYTEKERDRLLGYMSHYVYPYPDLLLQQGEFADSLWVLMPQQKAMMYALTGGELYKSGIVGDSFFNEVILRAQVPCTSTVQSEQGSQWLRLHADDFRQFIDNEAGNNASKREVLWKKLNVPDTSSELIAKVTPNFDFPLLPGESVESFDRRHWIVFLQKIFIPLIFFSGVVLGWGAITLAGFASWFVDGPVLALLFVTCLWMLWGWLDYLNDYFLVTNMRVAQVEKVIFFSEHRLTALLEQIRDVRFVQSTVWQTFWKYGTIYVQTAGQSPITFDFLRNPEQVKTKIIQLSLRRAEHYLAGGKREIFNALERQLGITIDTPLRTWVSKSTKPAATPRAWWRFFFSNQVREQYLTDQRADRVIWRKHWIILLGKIVSPVFLSLTSTAILLLVIWFYLSGASIVYAIAGIPLGMLGMFFWTWLWWAVKDWNNDIYEVTDIEIIDTEKQPLIFPFFNTDRRSANLGQVNDISYRINGPINSLLNVGHVDIETAAESGKFTFDWVYNPQGVADEIRRRIEQFNERKRTSENKRQAQQFPIWFEMYERLGKERETEKFN